MQVVEGSVLLRLWLALWGALKGWYEHSALHRLLTALTRGWEGWFKGSRFMGMVVREGTLVRAWRESGLLRGLTWLVNLPANLLGRLYRRFKGAFEGSIAAQLGFAMGRETVALIFWLMLGVMVTSYTYSNNMVSFLGFVAVAALFVVGGMRDKRRRLELVEVGPYLAFFVAAVFLSWPLSYLPSESFRFLFFHLTCALCVVVTVSAVERREDLTRLCVAVAATLVVIGGWGVIQGIQGVPVNYSYTDVVANAGMPGRVYSMYENPNSFAQALGLLIPPAAALLMCGKSRWGKLLGLLGAGLGTVAMVMTYSRGSWVGLAVSVVVFLFWWKRKLLPGFVLLAIACIPILPDAVFNRILSIFNTNDSSTMSRVPLYQASAELIAQRPILGAGLGTDVVRTAIRELNTYHGKAAFVHAHNLALQLWLETGLLGLVTFWAGMVSGVKSAAKAVARPTCDKGVKAVTLASAAAISGVLVSSMADYIWNYPRVMLIFWFVFAIMLAGIKLAKKEQG